MKKSILILVVILALGLVTGYSATIRQAFPEKSPGHFDAAAYVQEMQLKYQWLISESAPLDDRSVAVVAVSDEEITELETYTCTECNQKIPGMRKVRIGLVKPLDIGFDRGSKKATADGGYTWSFCLTSDTATALRVRFSSVNLPAKAVLYVYNATGEAFGPYAADGEFWSHTVTGPIIYVQMRHFGPAPVHEVPFKISGLGYIGKKFLLPFMQQKETTAGLNYPEALCNDNADCVVDASCYSGTAINAAKYAVAHIEWISGVWIYYCSGGLIADNDASTQVPYFLTANHCLSRTRDAAGLECYFQYWTANCNGACYDPVGAVPRTLGAVVVSTNKTGDYTLLLLSENPPSGSVFMGWTNSPVAFSDGVEIFRIHHPGGSPQSYTKQIVDVDAVTCSGWPRGSWIYSRDNIGATEGGSSGSPVYNMSGQIVGQLSGACGYNVNEPCDSESNATVDGAFASYYSEVAPYLDNGSGPSQGTMHVVSIDLSVSVQSVFTTVTANVVIKDETGVPVANATVSGEFTGDINGSKSAVTDATGLAVLSIKQKATINTFTFCVTGVTHASLTYNAEANNETCDTLQ